MKKIIAILLCSFMMNLSIPVIPAIAADNAENVSIEHVKLPKKLAKKTPTDVVNLTAEETRILPYNTLQVTFAQNFNSKFAIKSCFHHIPAFPLCPHPSSFS